MGCLTDTTAPHPASASGGAAALRLKKLIETNQALAQVESLPALLPLLLQNAKDVTNAVGASILLYKPESDTLEFTLAINEEAQAAQNLIQQKFELKIGEGIAGHVAAAREPVIVEDAQQDRRFFKKADKASGFITRSILCVPILYRDELLGVVQVLNAKDKDFFDVEDLDILVSFSHLAAVAMVRSRMLEAMLEQERMQAQLDAAARIQANFLPKIPDIGPGAGIYAITQQSAFVGGDFFDIIPMPDNSLLVLVADVSGKGLPAALVGASLWTKTRSLVTPDIDPVTLLTGLNAAMFDVLAQQLFATLVICRYWPCSGRTSIALAGHVPPMLVTRNEFSYVNELQGQPIGIDPVAEFTQLECILQPGQSLLLITDGVTDARNQQRRFFGEAGVEAFVCTHAGPPWGAALVDRIEAWKEGAPATDDLTVVEIWREPEC